MALGTLREMYYRAPLPGASKTESSVVGGDWGWDSFSVGQPCEWVSWSRLCVEVRFKCILCNNYKQISEQSNDKGIENPV